jgi:hypothetical protein
MRCLVKNLAMFGLGIYIFAKEDAPEMIGDSSYVPENSESPKKKPEPESKGIELVKDSDNWKKVAAYVTANKEKGLDAILQQVKRRYSVTDAIKAEIETLINA